MSEGSVSFHLRYMYIVVYTAKLTVVIDERLCCAPAAFFPNVEIKNN
jgi:hypothetical protein